MSLWCTVELLCPFCASWSQTGATTTKENFAEEMPHVLGGQVVLACGHEVTADRFQLRLGPQMRAAS